MVKKKRKKYPFWFEEPFESFRRMQDDFYKTMRSMWREPWFKMPELKAGTKFIPIRVGETNKELIIRAELPGFSKDEIKLKVTPSMVFISAEKKKKKVEKDEKHFKMERIYGSASRSLSLPEEVKSEKAEAKFEDGVLEIILPKKKVKKEKKREVKIK